MIPYESRVFVLLFLCLSHFNVSWLEKFLKVVPCLNMEHAFLSHFLHSVANTLTITLLYMCDQFDFIYFIYHLAQALTKNRYVLYAKYFMCISGFNSHATLCRYYPHFIVKQRCVTCPDMYTASNQQRWDLNSESLTTTL